MGRFYYICEKLRNNRSKFLNVFNGRTVTLAKLKLYSATTSNEVYALDVLSGQVIARRIEGAALALK
jgi:hypothetical protein